MIVWYIISFSLLAFYFSLILIFWLGWILIKQKKEPFKNQSKTKFTVLIPVRNEEELILENLKSLLSLDYPIELFEIFILNDHSTDRTGEITNQFMNDYPNFPLKLVDLSRYDSIKNKKDVITFGVNAAQTDWVVLTDGDCRRNPFWLKALNEFIVEKDCKMVYAPVEFSSNGVFEHIQALEFCGLVGIGGAAIRLKKPNMCSAANLAFTKDVFLEMGGYDENNHIASGDDEYLLHKVFKMYPNDVYFLKDLRALVSTSPNVSVEQLANQRRRWVSKSTHYENRSITAILAGAYFFNLSILLNFILSIFYTDFLFVALIQIGLKAMIEGLFLFDVLRFFKRSHLILFLLIAEPFHIFYVLIIGVWANMAGYNWKGRKHI
jgi:cellulose synthase/poly-beta-1,6-N-acetylglucosamine synthase-like glycosyltransferase